jgi:hypothetical protein
MNTYELFDLGDALTETQGPGGVVVEDSITSFA